MFPILPPSDSDQPKSPRPQDPEDQLDEEEGEIEDSEDQLDEEEEESQDPEELVTVATFPLLNAAELARLHLAEEGINSILLDAETVNMDWLLGNALGYIKLQVPRKHAEAAKEILEELKPSQGNSQSGDMEEEITLCLACGQEIPEVESKCPSCGWSFEDEQGH